MKIGVFIGSFNPVHKDHIRIVNHLIDNNYVDKVLIVPTGNYWDKVIIDIKHRINMLEVYESDKIIIEKELNNIQYTFDLMNELNKKYKNDELFLIIGADNIVSFDKWYHYEELLKYNLIIIKRNNIDIKSYLDKLNKIEGVYVLEDISLLGTSSTTVRNNIDNPIILNELLDKEVIDYIIKNNLYK